MHAPSTNIVQVPEFSYEDCITFEVLEKNANLIDRLSHFKLKDLIEHIWQKKLWVVKNYL